jgi:membrane-bound lytic murein transglycosylase D
MLKMRLFQVSQFFMLLLVYPIDQSLKADSFSYLSFEIDCISIPVPENPGIVDIVIESRIARLNEFTPVSLEYNKYVKDYILLFTTDRKDDMEKIIGFSDYYFPMIESQLDLHQLPFELKYLAVLESGLDPFAVSSSGAVGLWQFLLHSARMFNLEVNSFIDERRDPLKSTVAACQYLVYLYDMFNDWHLALAAYNGGPGVVRTAIERAGGTSNFWEIREFLPEQTRNYVPAFIAITYLMNHYKEHGFVPQIIPGNYDKTDTIWAKQPLSFQGISSVLNISPELLSFLNPSYKTGYIPNAGDKIPLVLPFEYIGSFYEKESSIYSSSSEEHVNQYRKNPFGNELRKVKHKVRKGEFLHMIAVKYRSNPDQIKAWNNLKSDVIHEGQELNIWISAELYEMITVKKKEQNQQGKSMFLQ